jgi:hypothetical protein
MKLKGIKISPILTGLDRSVVVEGNNCLTLILADDYYNHRIVDIILSNGNGTYSVPIRYLYGSYLAIRYIKTLDGIRFKVEKNRFGLDGGEFKTMSELNNIFMDFSFNLDLNEDDTKRVIINFKKFLDFTLGVEDIKPSKTIKAFNF